MKKRNFKQKAAELRDNLSALFLAMKRRDTPLPAKIAAAAAVCYALSPIDLIPDFIPVLGYLDDLLILPLLIGLAVRLTPVEILKECREQSRGMWEGGKPKMWLFALPIILFWVILIGLICWRVFFSSKK